MGGPIPDVIVIGAGIAGITAACELARAQRSVVVLEARERIGGRIWTVRDFCGEPVECGAEFVHGREAATWPEIKKAKLETRVSPPIRRTAFNLGGATRWLPWTLIHPGTWPCAGMRGAIARSGAPDLSARQFIDRRGYRGQARMLTEMTFLQHMPGSADDVGLFGFVDDGVLDLQTRLNFRIVPGYDSFPRALANGLDIRLDCPVDSVFWESKAGGYAFTTGANSKRKRRSRPSLWACCARARFASCRHFRSPNSAHLPTSRWGRSSSCSSTFKSASGRGGWKSSNAPWGRSIFIGPSSAVPTGNRLC